MPGSGKHVFLASDQARPMERAERVLRGAGYTVSRVVRQEDLDALPPGERPPDLMIVDGAFGEGGIDVCRRLRHSPVWRKVSLMVMLREGEPPLGERPISGVNDLLQEPFEADDLLDKVHRLTVIPARRELNTLVRVRDPRSGSTLLGKTLNVSLNGILIEVEGEVAVGGTVELEFLLPEAGEPLHARAKVIRPALELELRHQAFGLRLEEMADRDVERLVDFMEQREHAGSHTRELG